MDSDDKNNRKDLESQLEKFLDHSKFYLNRLPLLKSQLCEINHVNQPNLYVEKLSKLEKDLSMMSFIFSYQHNMCHRTKNNYIYIKTHCLYLFRRN